MKVHRISQSVKTQYGKTLEEEGLSGKVRVYRAAPATADKIRNHDYITRSFKFAKGHADHMSFTEEENYAVLSASIDASLIANASNPGEYFYIGQDDVVGIKVYEVKF